MRTHPTRRGGTCAHHDADQRVVQVSGRPAKSCWYSSSGKARRVSLCIWPSDLSASAALAMVASSGDSTRNMVSYRPINP
jgi:hypothetical protein